jgi:hypothetical protein
LRTIK